MSELVDPVLSRSDNNPMTLGEHLEGSPMYNKAKDIGNWLKMGVKNNLGLFGLAAGVLVLNDLFNVPPDPGIQTELANNPEALARYNEEVASDGVIMDALEKIVHETLQLPYQFFTTVGESLDSIGQLGADGLPPGN